MTYRRMFIISLITLAVLALVAFAGMDVIAFNQNQNLNNSFDEIQERYSEQRSSGAFYLILNRDILSTNSETGNPCVAKKGMFIQPVVAYKNDIIAEYDKGNVPSIINDECPNEDLLIFNNTELSATTKVWINRSDWLFSRGMVALSIIRENSDNYDNPPAYILNESFTLDVMNLNGISNFEFSWQCVTDAHTEIVRLGRDEDNCLIMVIGSNSAPITKRELTCPRRTISFIDCEHFE